MSTISKITKKTNKGTERRQAIIQCACEDLLSVGYASLSMRDIAKRMGISLGNLQYYFTTKDALVIAVIEKEIEIDLDIARNIQWDRNDRRESIYHSILTMMERLVGPSGHLHLTAAFLALHDDRYRELQAQNIEKILGAMTIIIQQLAPEISDERQAQVSLVAVAMFDGTVAQIHAMAKPIPPETFDRLAKGLTDALDRLLQP